MGETPGCSTRWSSLCKRRGFIFQSAEIYGGLMVMKCGIGFAATPEVRQRLAKAGVPPSILSILPVPSAAPKPPAKPAASEPGLYATIHTNLGPITFRLLEKEAPLTVKNFVELAKGTKAWKDPKTGRMVKRPLYNGTTFHKIVPQYMISGGDPTGTGTKPRLRQDSDEVNPKQKFTEAGRVVMANSGRPNSGSCQFFITVRPTQWLVTGNYTVFGQVVDGLDLADKIGFLPRNMKTDRPLRAVRIINITFKQVGGTK